jgi:hypothetical protein
MRFTILIVLILTTFSAIAQDKPSKEPAALALARENYEAKIKAAVDPIKAAFLKHLETMKKAYGAKGDLESAQAVQNEIDSLTTTKPKPAVTIVGKWSWNKSTTAEFREDGTAKCSDGNTGKWKCLDKKTHKYQTVWADGNFDRMQMSADGQSSTVKNNNTNNTFDAQRLPEP